MVSRLCHRRQRRVSRTGCKPAPPGVHTAKTPAGRLMDYSNIRPAGFFPLRGQRLLSYIPARQSRTEFCPLKHRRSLQRAGGGQQLKNLADTGVTVNAKSVGSCRLLCIQVIPDVAAGARRLGVRPGTDRFSKGECNRGCLSYHPPLPDSGLRRTCCRPP